MKIQNWLKNFFYFHSLSYFFSVSLDEERKSRTNHSMICLSSFVIEQIRTSFTLCWKFKIDQKIFFTKQFSFFISVLLYSIGRRKEIIHNLLFFLPSYVWHVERNEIERITILRWKFKIDRKIFFTFTFFRSVAWRKENRERIILLICLSLFIYLSPFLPLRFKIDRKIFFHLSLILGSPGILTNSLPTRNIWHNRMLVLFNERYRRTMRRNRAGDSSRNCIVENRGFFPNERPIDVSREYSKIIRRTFPPF